MAAFRSESEERINAIEGSLLLATELRCEYRDSFKREFGHAMLHHGPAIANGVTIRWAILVGLVQPFGTDSLACAEQAGASG